MPVKRHEFSTKTRKAARRRSAGKCERCGKLLWFRGDARYDHIIACYWGGKGTIDNLQLLCVECDKIKTRGDHKTIAKSKKTQRRHQEHLARMALKGRGVSEARPRRRWA